MQMVSQIGGSVTNSLAYIGSLASLGGRAAYYTVVGPFQGKPLHFQRTVTQALDVGVRALPIVSLITFFIALTQSRRSPRPPNVPQTRPPA